MQKHQQNAELPGLGPDAEEIRIVPGHWRPQYPWEQIAWISSPWASHDYLWLDFPEAIFTEQGLLYLSHVNPRFPVRFPDQNRVEWQTETEGLSFCRTLPNGVRFGGTVRKRPPASVALELFLENGSEEPLTDIRLQACVFLNAVEEFSERTNTNKFVHAPDRGWISLEEAFALPAREGCLNLGFRGTGKPVADWPIIATISNRAERLLAMTWHDHTASLIGNPNHPCMHADPRFGDLKPGQSAGIYGDILFFEGALDDFTEHLGFDGGP